MVRDCKEKLQFLLKNIILCLKFKKLFITLLGSKKDVISNINRVNQ